MKRVAIFDTTKEGVILANEHLAQFPPEQVANVEDKIVVHYDDQTYPNSYKIEELSALMLSNTKEAMTTNIAIKVSLLELSDATEALKDAESKLEELNATTIKGNDKESKELHKDKKEKVRAYEFVVNGIKERIKNIENGISGLRKTVKNFDNKNKVLAEEIAILRA